MNKAVSTSQMDPKTLVVGVGNLQCGDDGAGIQVARLLRSRALPQVEISEIHANDAATLALPSNPGGAIFIVNTTISGQRPGFVHRSESHNGQIPEHLLYPGLHNAPQWSEWLKSASQSGGWDSHLIHYAIEGGNFARGAEISPEVQKAVHTVLQCLIVDIGSRIRRQIPALRAASQAHAGSISG